MNPIHRILLVDDNLDTRAALSDVLTEDGYAVIGLSTAAEMLSQGDLQKYTAIILDRELPDNHVDQLLPKLRDLAPETSLVIATGAADLEGTIASLRHGASDYLLKPVNPDLLRASIGRLKQLREFQQRANDSEHLAAVGQMVSAVAHESRSLLQCIQGHTELMRLSVQDQPGPPELLADLDALESANAKLAHMFDELREYSAPIMPTREETQLIVPIERAWQTVSQLARARESSMQVRARTDMTCWVDVMHMEQVFRNLLENALAACPGRADITVNLSATALHDGVDAIEVSVRDNGPGFTEQQRLQAFEPFFTTRHTGTGLGLAICKRIVAAHHGRISISTSPRQGAEIVIALPRHAAPSCSPSKSSGTSRAMQTV